MAARRDPIKRVELSDGRVRYRFVVDVGTKSNGKRDQRTFTFDTLKEARGERARILHEVGRGTYVKPDRRLTVQAYFEQWLESKQGKRPSTRRCYADALKPVIDRYGQLALQVLDVPHLERVKAAMLDGTARRIGTKGKPLSARSVNLTLTVAGMALEQAVKRGLVVRNIAQLVERVPGDAKSGAAWTAEQANAFTAVVSQNRLHAAWLLTTYGLRRGEVLGLTWDRVDLEEGTIAITGPTACRTVVAGKVVVGPPKTRRGERTLPVDKGEVAALRALKTQQARERLAAGEAYDGSEDLVVVDELGRPPRPEWYSDAFARLARQAGVPVIRLHDARHTSVTIMRSLGIPDHVVAAWHGHDEAVMRATYTHTSTDELRAAATARFGDV